MPKLSCRVTALTITGVFALAACTGTGTDTSPTPAPSTPAASSASPVTLPDTPVGTAAQWVLDTLAAESGPTVEEANEKFTPEFLSQVPAEQLAAVFDQLRSTGPYTVTLWESHGTNAQARLTGTDAAFGLMIGVDDAGLINGLMFTPAEEAPDVASPAEASSALAAQAQQSSFLLADVTGEGDALQCTPVEARNTDQPLPIGSMFKLYVLGAVVTAVEDGTLTWDDELTVTEELKSLPSGTLQDEPVGSTRTVRETAELMISISDNTATDMLIDAVGREQVEAEVEAMQHSSPELLKPFLTTREMFQLAASDAELRERWGTASQGAVDASPEVSAAQREVLGDLPQWDRQIDEALFADPFWDEGLDWFATAEDLCRAHVALQQRADTPAGEPIRAILSKNPGVALPDADYVGFKGGSSVAEIGLSFYVERGDTRRVLVMQTAADTPTEVPQESWFAELAEKTLLLS